MSKIQDNLEREKRLVELLGYSLIGPDGSNRWLIVDENKNQVGYIQYKKLYNANEKKGYKKTFGYHTEIDSSNIKFELTRKLTDRNGRILDNYGYSFDIKRDSQDVDHVEMNMGDFPYLTIWSSKYGFMCFDISSRGLHLNYKSNTDNFKLEETIIYENLNYKNEYVYQIHYCQNKYNLSDDNSKGSTTREISGAYIRGYNKQNTLEINEKTWVNGHLRTNRQNIVEGTVKEMVVKHEMGIDSFNHFRFLINQIIPFKEDVISAIVSDDIIQKRGLSMFFDCNEKENTNTNAKTKKLKI